MEKPNKNLLSIPGILVIIILLSGCMNMRVVAEYDSSSPTTTKVTKWNYLWGLVQPQDVETDSLCESICQVTAKNNIGYILIAAATLGIVVPMSMEYECCAHEPEPEDL